MNQNNSAPDTVLMIALPKGRLADQTIDLFAAAGVPLPGQDPGRRLILASDDGAVRYVMAKPSDVPTFVEYGAANLGTDCAWLHPPIALTYPCATRASRASPPSTPTLQATSFGHAGSMRKSSPSTAR